MTEKCKYGTNLNEFKIYEYLYYNSIKNDNIVKIYDVSEKYIKMEMLGVDYKNMPLEIRQLLNYKEIIDSLNQNGIFHGDVRHHNFG